MSISPIDLTGGTARLVEGASVGSDQQAREASIREVAQQLEGVFIQQLFQAMRQSAPAGSTATERTSNDFFGSMMDEHLAGSATAGRASALGEAIYRQLAGLAGVQPSQPTPTPAEAGEAQK